jgi:hypothetical protein
MKVTGFAAVVLTVIYIALAIWSVYFLIKIAEHVNAWPF